MELIGLRGYSPNKLAEKGIRLTKQKKCNVNPQKDSIGPFNERKLIMVPNPKYSYDYKTDKKTYEFRY
jgi:hypothetical protein